MKRAIKDLDFLDKYCTRLVLTEKEKQIVDKLNAIDNPQVYTAEEVATGLKSIKEKIKMTTEHDNVNHPKHYEREGAMECIDEMIMFFGKDVVAHFCLCNAWKYRYRAADKNGEEDIRKSDWYIRKYKELTEKTSNCGCRNPYQE